MALNLQQTKPFLGFAGRLLAVEPAKPRVGFISFSEAMISIEEVKQDLGEHLTDAQAENLRDALYSLVENLLDDYIDSCARIETTCKKQLSTVEYPLNDKRMKDTV